MPDEVVTEVAAAEATVAAAQAGAADAAADAAATAAREAQATAATLAAASAANAASAIEEHAEEVDELERDVKWLRQNQEEGAGALLSLSQRQEKIEATQTSILEALAGVKELLTPKPPEMPTVEPAETPPAEEPTPAKRRRRLI